MRASNRGSSQASRAPIADPPPPRRRDALAISLGGLIACATSIPFEPSSASPAAAGNVHAQVDDNGNAWVELELEHLALPGTLTPPRATYVVWAES